LKTRAMRHKWVREKQSSDDSSPAVEPAKA
jgi:hypothetical protein